jgi:hypothetical protein
MPLCTIGKSKLRRPGERPVPGQFGVILNNVVCGVRPFVSDTSAIASSPAASHSPDEAGPEWCRDCEDNPPRRRFRLERSCERQQAIMRHILVIFDAGVSRSSLRERAISLKDSPPSVISQEYIIC